MEQLLIVSHFKTDVGFIEVRHDEQFVYYSDFILNCTAHSNHPMSELIGVELYKYSSDPNYAFQLPLKPQGSTYQQQVWNQLLVIPSGTTITYGQMARALNSSPRAIGQACKRNPLPLFIPCHRVVGEKNLGGYMGNKATTIHHKERLIAHEAKIKANQGL